MYKSPVSKKYALTVAITGKKVIRLLYTRFFRVVKSHNKYGDLIIEEISESGMHIRWCKHEYFRKLPDNNWFILD